MRVFPAAKPRLGASIIQGVYTFFYKKVFPTFWFGFLGFLAFDSIKDGTIANDPMFIVVPCLMAVFGFFFMRKFIWDLADEVFDGGDFLLVKYRGAEDKILLANIMNVSASASTNPPRITLRLIKPSKLGNEISFSPDAPLSLNPFAKNPIAEELIVRVHMAKATHAV